ncbi:MAG: DNA replication/repair protein RecF [Chloroflexota bacterium]|nr:DNA replication/repair protein RecF [Chloroflexota bacterium]
MLLRRLKLTNFRNLPNAALELDAGLTLFHGANAQGKSNLLEAAYLLAIGRSYRAAAEREMVAWAAREGDGYAVVSGTVERGGEPDELLVGLDLRQGETVQKRVQINGSARRASDLVGRFNAVLFSADDIALVYGAPQGRRRYLDVLLSQADPRYLRALQRYQRVVQQRNRLLKGLKEGRAGEQELLFWDAKLCEEGAQTLAARLAAVGPLSEAARRCYAAFGADGDALEVAYAPTIGVPDAPSEGALADAIREALTASRRQERALAQTMVGPHRDDLRLTMRGVELAQHASRGQARLAALSLRLAEAELLAARRGDQPVLLLDDVLSELDAEHRALTMEAAATYSQTLATTADTRIVPERFRASARRFRVVSGAVFEEEEEGGET